MSLTSANPRGALRSTVTDFLLALNSRKYQESCPGWPRKDVRPGSPPLGFSTFTTSAPSQASASVQEGPASNCVRSNTRTPLKYRRTGGSPSMLASPPAAGSPRALLHPTVPWLRTVAQQGREPLFHVRGWGGARPPG